MLVLSRQKNEVVVINDTIRVMVVDIRGDKVRLGFEAPGMEIHREEVWMVVQAERKELDCGSLGHVSPDGLSQAIKRGIDSKPKNYQHED